MKNLVTRIIFVLFLLYISFVFLYPFISVSAAIKSPLERLQSFGDKAGFNIQETDPQRTFTNLLGMIITAFLSLLGLIFLILIIYAGFTWMTAAGDEVKVTKAKDTLKHAIIGMTITAGSFAIWQFIIEPIL